MRLTIYHFCHAVLHWDNSFYAAVGCFFSFGFWLYWRVNFLPWRLYDLSVTLENEISIIMIFLQWQHHSHCTLPVQGLPGCGRHPPDQRQKAPAPVNRTCQTGVKYYLAATSLRAVKIDGRQGFWFKCQLRRKPLASIAWPVVPN